MVSHKIFDNDREFRCKNATNKYFFLLFYSKYWIVVATKPDKSLRHCYGIFANSWMLICGQYDHTKLFHINKLFYMNWERMGQTCQHNNFYFMALAQNVFSAPPTPIHFHCRFSLWRFWIHLLFIFVVFII